MGKEIADKIIDDLIEGLPKDIPNVIYISGGDKDIRKDVIMGIASQVKAIVTDSPSLRHDYEFKLESFIKKYTH